MASDEGRFLTVREVAERLRLHPITVRRHIAAGRIRAIRIGRAVRVPEGELVRFNVKDVSQSHIAEARARYGVKSQAGVEPASQREARVPGGGLGPGAARRRPGIRPTKAQLAQRRKAVDDLLAFRARQRPGPPVEELVREGRGELDRRAERNIGMDH